MKMKNIIRSAQRNAKTAFLMCAAFSLCLTACSDDDESNGGGSGDLPATSDLGITHPVTGIMENGGNTATYNYTDGRLTSGHSLLDDMDFTIGGSPLRIWCGVEESDGETYEETFTNIRTNSHGAITYADVNYREEGYGEVFEGSGTLTAEYDGDNRIQRLTATDESNEDGETYSEETTVTFTWEGNNITGITYMYAEGTWEDPDEKDYYDTESYTFSYGDNPETNSGIYIPYFVIDLDFMSYAGLFGRTTSHIPESATIDGQNYEFSVDKDSQGRITAFYENGYLYESYFYDGQTPSAARTTINKAPAKTKGHGLMRKIAKRIIARNTGR